ncbi:GTPase-activating protein gyp8 [Vanrija albida]|uniref:GTPase-activating protein gyp8 n=1 Tax=Vanrija albida TaxID=181172 RepID=A0ABR3PU88_9TREE
MAVDEKAASWVDARDAAVDAAIAAHDDAALQRLSAEPGGFGSNASRRRAWREVLRLDRVVDAHPVDSGAVVAPERTGADTPTASTPTPSTPRDADSAPDTPLVHITLDRDSSPTAQTDDGLPPHRDEGQVRLDTRRSFVTYPKGLTPGDKTAMQADLQALIVAVLQRHPGLNYFQGFHDIMTVLYLTVLDRTPRAAGEKTSEEDERQWDELLAAAEVVSLCRVRDAMGKSLGPMMGMLRLLRRVLAVADPQLYRVSASISPVPTLPFFALSWILTLFSHDVDTLEPVQRIFDYLITRNPISAIYLAVAILVAKKPQMLRLAAALGPEARADPSLLHPLFARLPPLYADTPDAPTPPPPPPINDDDDDDDDDDNANPYTPIALSTVFLLADKLQAKYPWDGPRIRGLEVMGPGSVVQTYSADVDPEKGSLSLADAAEHIDKDVILPGGDALDDDEEVAPPRRWPVSLPQLHLPPSLRVPPNRVGTVIAFGVVVLGIGTALYGWRAGGPRASWAQWWGLVARSWAVRSVGLGHNGLVGGLAERFRLR